MSIFKRDKKYAWCGGETWSVSGTGTSHCPYDHPKKMIDDLTEREYCDKNHLYRDIKYKKVKS